MSNKDINPRELFFETKRFEENELNTGLDHTLHVPVGYDNLHILLLKYDVSPVKQLEGDGLIEVLKKASDWMEGGTP